MSLAQREVLVGALTGLAFWFAVYAVIYLAA